MTPLPLTLLAASTIAFGQSQGQVRIAVGPNVLVSRDGDVAHVESGIASNPRDPINLVATAITFTLPQGGYVNKTYATFDGGLSWYDARLPEDPDLGSIDPKIAFTPRGTALRLFILFDYGIIDMRKCPCLPAGGLPPLPSFPARNATTCRAVPHPLPPESFPEFV